MTRRIPLLAVALGLGGLTPFVGLGLLALGPDPEQAQAMTLLLLGYGAVILSFLGAVHWGLALAEHGTASAASERARLAGGVVPALLGWAALALPALRLPSWTGLVLLIGGFAATILVEFRASRRGLLPNGYLWLRAGLTLMVLAMLVTVATLHILGNGPIY